MDALKALLSSSEPFMPHGHCYLWKPGLLWLHVVSDALIALAYLSIPFTLMYFARKRRGLPFRWLFISFGFFIVACGATHALEVWNVWWADYWLAGGVKAVTAAVSVATAVLLARAMPEALTLPTPGELQRANEDLARLHRQLQDAYDEAARHSQERYRALVEAATDAVVSAGDSGRIVLFNAAAERIFGYTASEVFGREAWVLAAPEVTERLRANLVRFLATGETEIVGQTVELQARRKSGELFPAELSLSVTKEEGRPVFTGFIRDITGRKRAEEELRLQSAALEAAANAIVITGRDGAIIWANQAFSRLTGWGPRECLGQNTRILKSGHHERSFYQELWQTILSGRVWQGEMVNRRKDGSLYFEEQTITPVRSDRGGITHFIGIKVDIGGRKTAQEALLRSERRYRALAEAAHDDIFIVDREGRVQYVNTAAAGRLGRPPEEIAGKRLEELFPPAIAARFRDSVAQVFASGADRYAEEPARYGEREVWIGTWLVPLESGGEVESVMGVSRDITDRVRAEQALRASEERYRLLFERNLAGVFRTSLDGRILECNDAFARIYGYANRGEIVARNASELYPTPEARRLLIERLRERDTLLDFELQGRRRDGSLLWALVNASLLREGGEAGAFVIEGTAFDITDRKRLERQLRQAQKMEAIGQLAGGVAHDFNNLLGVIGGHTELALKRLGLEDPLRRHLDEIRQAGDRAAGLTRQLLAFSRKQIVEPTLLDLNEVVRGLAGMLGRLIPEDIQLVTVLGAEPALVSADRGQVEQVMMNLVVNARDAMPQGGRLAIETGHAALDEAYCREHEGARPGPHVMLAVSDTGIGMDAETRSHVFEPFFTTKEPGKGTGLGLATVYGIVKQAGGSIWVYSEPGQGTTFKVYLPRAEEGAGLARPAAAPGETPRGTETILLVEDEETLRTLTREVLEALGYTVLEARHGVEALELSEGRQGRIDLLLTDVVMPHMSGRELAERLLASRPETRALFISGYTDDAAVRHRLVESPLAFLQKPFTADALARKVRGVLDAPRAS